MQISPQTVENFLSSIEDQQKRMDSIQLIELMQSETGFSPKMWGSNMVGFGSSHYKYESGREGDTFIMGFAPRKQAIVLYGILYYDQNLELSRKLGKHSAGKGCLYIKRLADVDIKILRGMIAQACELKA